MTCDDCSKIQDIAFDKNESQTVPIAYYRIQEANVAIVGCSKHVSIAINMLNSVKRGCKIPKEMEDDEQHDAVTGRRLRRVLNRKTLSKQELDDYMLDAEDEDYEEGGGMGSVSK